jgi:hypothetical protein
VICPAPALASSALRTNVLNLFWRNSKPFQKALVPIRMAGLKQFVPLLHFRVVQPNVSIHSNPFFFTDVFFHSSSRFVVSRP